MNQGIDLTWLDRIFERLEHYYYPSHRKSHVTGALEKDRSFKWGTFHQELNYNEIKPYLVILHKTE